MSILEAMGQGRPVVSTGVGGVPDVVKGCGIVTPPGDVHRLSMAVTTLLRSPSLCWELGQRGHQRLTRMFSESACVNGYRELLIGAADPPVPTAADSARLAA
jgi:polysaccharide biosynthesis protein PelF